MSEDLLGLTLHQPWAWVVSAGHKPIENRPWGPWKRAIGKRIAIHAGKLYDRNGEIYVRRVMPDLDFTWKARLSGCILGTAVVAGVTRSDPSPWFFGPFGWLLEDITELPEPVTCRGAQGLWVVPPETAARVLAAAPAKKETPR